MTVISVNPDKIELIKVFAEHHTPVINNSSAFCALMLCENCVVSSRCTDLRIVLTLTSSDIEILKEILPEYVL